MPKVGVEPTRAFAHYTLNIARLPIPPLRLFPCSFIFSKDVHFTEIGANVNTLPFDSFGLYEIDPGIDRFEEQGNGLYFLSSARC